MSNQFTAIAAATVVAGLITLVMPGWSPAVEASTPIPAAKSDTTRAACERTSWPYYEPHCIRDDRNNAGRANAVRMISTDRLDRASPRHSAWPAWSASFAELQQALPPANRTQ